MILGRFHFVPRGTNAVPTQLSAPATVIIRLGFDRPFPGPARFRKPPPPHLSPEAEMDRLQDIDPLETREWVDSLEAVLELEGPQRAHFLLEQLVDKARRSGAYLPYRAQTAYINTIPPHLEEPIPGDQALEARLRSYVRWNAVAMVLRAGKKDLELGGHIASFASAATLYDVGFNHFWHAPERQPRRRPRLLPGPLLAGHLCARLPRRAPDARSSSTTSARKSTARACRSYPHPVAHARLLAVPDGVDGPGPDHGDLPGALHALPGAPRPRRRPHDRKVWAFLGDGEMDEPESLGAHRAGRRARSSTT